MKKLYRTFILLVLCAVKREGGNSLAASSHSIEENLIATVMKPSEIGISATLAFLLLAALINIVGCESTPEIALGDRIDGEGIAITFTNLKPMAPLGGLRIEGSINYHLSVRIENTGAAELKMQGAVLIQDNGGGQVEAHNRFEEITVKPGQTDDIELSLIGFGEYVEFTLVLPTNQGRFKFGPYRLAAPVE